MYIVFLFNLCGFLLFKEHLYFKSKVYRTIFINLCYLGTVLSGEGRHSMLPKLFVIVNGVCSNEISISKVLVTANGLRCIHVYVVTVNSNIG